MPVYIEVVQKLDNSNVHYIQFDEPCLALNLTEAEQQVFMKTYEEIKNRFPHLHIMLASYFECYGQNLSTALSLPVQTLHLDLVRCPSQLDDILTSGFIKAKTNLSLGVVDGRNIWKNDFQYSLSLIKKAIAKIGSDGIQAAMGDV